MVERTKNGYRLTEEDGESFYRMLHNPTKTEVNVTNSYFDKLQKEIQIEQLDDGDFIARIYNNDNVT